MHVLLFSGRWQCLGWPWYFIYLNIQRSLFIFSFPAGAMFTFFDMWIVHFVAEMPILLLHYLSEDTGACKIVIAAELSGVALSLLKVRESGMILYRLSRLYARLCEESRSEIAANVLDRIVARGF